MAEALRPACSVAEAAAVAIVVADTIMAVVVAGIIIADVAAPAPAMAVLAMAVITLITVVAVAAATVDITHIMEAAMADATGVAATATRVSTRVLRPLRPPLRLQPLRLRRLPLLPNSFGQYVSSRLRPVVSASPVGARQRDIEAKMDRFS